MPEHLPSGRGDVARVEARNRVLGIRVPDGIQRDLQGWLRNLHRGLGRGRRIIFTGTQPISVHSNPTVFTMAQFFTQYEVERIAERASYYPHLAPYGNIALAYVATINMNSDGSACWKAGYRAAAK